VLQVPQQALLFYPALLRITRSPSAFRAVIHRV
jgi:hypothetical protein